MPERDDQRLRIGFWNAHGAEKDNRQRYAADEEPRWRTKPTDCSGKTARTPAAWGREHTLTKARGDCGRNRSYGLFSRSKVPVRHSPVEFRRFGLRLSVTVTG